ncbi:PD-(D/E)XK nuclease family protein [Romboutsia sp. 1001713B170207_170306_H8]|uniref:PD-(D/E)XK nuclease family protein n=1 Tax=Romboutsia sp. 1001713B170207_170306_H8 TaxID=2787112 RepID=UPI0018977A28|nr:PD-(D/E)XK nuclease family protein [Romboutsia sp. 1001713B170207_170306_H8]
MIDTIPAYPELTWSASRLNLLNKCEREYYYNYYGSHNGYSELASNETREIYKLKKLTNKNSLSGTIIHDKAKEFIKLVTLNPNYTISPSFLERHINVAIYNFRNDCKKSNDYNSSWTPQVKGFNMLQEYYYGEKINKFEGEEIKGILNTCICNIVLSYTFEDIHSNKLNVLINGDGNFTSFDFKGTKVYAILDLLYINSEGKYVIVDWKTGNEDDKHRNQMLAYAKYVSDTYGIDVRNIICRLEYLSSGSFIEYSFSNTDLNNLSSTISSDIDILKSYLDDPILNKAKDISFFKTAEDTKFCCSCKYKGKCN